MAARTSIRARAALTAIAIFLVSASVDRRALGRRAGCAGRQASRRAGSASSSSTPCWPAQRSDRCRKPAAKSRKRPAPPSGCSRSLRSGRPSSAAAAAFRCRCRARGEVAFDDVRFAYPTRPTFTRSTASRFASRAGRESRDRRTFRRRQEHDLSSAAALLRSGCRPHHARRRAARRSRSRGAARAASRWCRRTARCLPASVRDNIRFGRPDASDAEVARAAEHAHAASFIAALPRAWTRQSASAASRCQAGSGSASPSRAPSCATRRLLLLDEATSSLDAESETQVAAALAELMRERTTIVIAHRLATVLSCDRILVLDQGRSSRRARTRRLPPAAASTRGWRSCSFRAPSR